MNGAPSGGVADAFAELPGLVGFDLGRPSMTGKPVTVTALWPLLRPFHEAALYRVAVHVAKLLLELCVSENLEVVVSTLPELWAVPLSFLEVCVLRTRRRSARQWTLGSLSKRWT